jgi:cell division protein FtsA
MEEIIEHIQYEIKNSGYEKKLIGGIVITGGGAQLKHIKQLVEYMTGMDARIGYPNEHLAKGADDLMSPMYATSVGLVIKGFQEFEVKKSREKILIPEAIPVDKSRGRSFRDSFLTRIEDWFKEEPDQSL